MVNRDMSEANYWFDSLPEPPGVRTPLQRSTDTDVAIIGAGYSGLWTAYYLRRLRPSLRITILEAQRVGFGASGRNGGWVTCGASGEERLLADPRTCAQGIALQREMDRAVDEVGQVARDEGFDCHYRKGGGIHFATNPAQEARLRAAAAAWSARGQNKEDCRWLAPEELSSHIRPRGQRGGLWHRHYAVVHPARLALGLAAAVDRAGVRIYEGSPAKEIHRGRVTTPGGDLRAEIVILATEAYTALLPGRRRSLLPLHSWMFATEPLSAAQWDEIGCDQREAFGDGRRLVTYGQRTEDGRLAFGARGGYAFGSPIIERFDPGHPHYRAMEELLRSFFPVLEGVKITHHWGGAFGVPRTWLPSVGLDRAAGLGRLGGYVGQGVAASNLAGQTMAELIAGEETERTALPWVTAATRSWEPEPFRWLGVTAVAKIAERADEADDQGRPAPTLARIFERITGR